MEYINRLEKVNLKSLEKKKNKMRTHNPIQDKERLENVGYLHP
jgi:hypothetical protein